MYNKYMDDSLNTYECIRAVDFWTFLELRIILYVYCDASYVPPWKNLIRNDITFDILNIYLRYISDIFSMCDVYVKYIRHMEFLIEECILNIRELNGRI